MPLVSVIFGPYQFCGPFLVGLNIFHFSLLSIFKEKCLYYQLKLKNRKVDPSFTKCNRKKAKKLYFKMK